MLTIPRTYDPAVELALGKCLRLLTPVRPVDYAMVIGRRMVDKVVPFPIAAIAVRASKVVCSRIDTMGGEAEVWLSWENQAGALDAFDYLRIDYLREEEEEGGGYAAAAATAAARART